MTTKSGKPGTARKAGATPGGVLPQAFRAARETEARLEAVAALIHARACAPIGAGWIRLQEILVTASNDPKIKASPGALNIVELMIVLTSDDLTDPSGERMLDALYKVMSVRGGGANATVDHDEVRRYHSRLVKSAAHAAVSQTAARYEISTRQVSRIVGKAPKR